MSRGNFTFQWNGEAVAQDVKAAMREALIEGSVTLTREMRRNIAGPSPSKPGDFPGLDHGTLRSSVNFNLIPAEMKSKIGTHLKYGRWLEYGTSRMLARPWVLRSYELARALIHKKMTDEATRVLASKVASRAGGAK